MKTRNFFIAAGFALCTVALTNGKTLMVQADTVTDMKSQGIISYNNHTPEDPSDDVRFDAADFILLESRIRETEAKIAAVETSLGLSPTAAP